MILSQHAQIRSKQRGISHSVVDAICANYDAEAYVGDGVWALRITKSFARQLRKEAIYDAETIAKVDGIAVLTDGDTVITVIRAKRSKAFRPYVKGRSHRREWRHG